MLNSTSRSQHKPQSHQKHKSSNLKKASWKEIPKILALPVWVWSITYFSQLVIIYPLFFILGRETLQTPVWTAVTGALVYILSLILVVFLPVKLFKKWHTSREELGLNGLPTWSDLGLAPVGFIVYFVLALILVYVFSFFPFFDASQAQDTGFSILSTNLDKIVAFFALVIIPPIFEEILFRGWLYGKLRAKIPGKFSLIISVLITSIVFGILHGQWNVGVNVFAMSIILCALREITGTIYSGILLHMLKNGVAFAMLYIFNFMV